MRDNVSPLGGAVHHRTGRGVRRATDTDLRKLADLAFRAITNVEERLKHDETVRAWIDEHERRNRA